MELLWIVVIIQIILAVVGGITLSKLLFLVLVLALIAAVFAVLSGHA